MPLTLSKALIAFALGAFLFLLWQFFSPQELLVLNGKTMGTSWSIQSPDKLSAAETSALLNDIQSLLHKLDREIFSTYSENSEISRFNQLPVNTVFPVSTELEEVLLAALRINRLSGGVFDVTIGPLTQLWGFGSEVFTRVPESAAIEMARLRVNSQALQIDEKTHTLLKTADVEVDLSAIAKGYAVDQLANLLRVHQVQNFLVEIGGEVRLAGHTIAGRNWLVAIEAPVAGIREPFTTITVDDNQELALAGSGDYRNFYISDGKRYAHELDPRSGFPVTHQLASVTVLAETAMLADAWATALMVLGPEAGSALAEELNLAVYFISHEGVALKAMASSRFTAIVDSSEYGSSVSSMSADELIHE